MKNILFILLLNLVPLALTAQTDTTKVVKEDTTLYRIVKTDGTDLIGYILKQDEREILVKTADGRKIIIPQYVVKQIIAVNSSDFSSKGEFVGEDPFATRYFISTNGLPLKKGENYIQWNLFGPDFQFAVGDNFGLGIMTSWLAMPLIGTAKYSFKLGDKAHGAVGTMLGTSSWAAFANPDFNFGLALPFATVSAGSRRSNMAFSAGYGAFWTGGDVQGRALLSVAGMTKISPKLSLVFDSFIVTKGKSEFRTSTEYVYNQSTGNYDEIQVTEEIKKPGIAFLIPGLRWHQAEGKAFQFGFTGVIYGTDMLPIPIPMVQWYRTL